MEVWKRLINLGLALPDVLLKTLLLFELALCVPNPLLSVNPLVQLLLLPQLLFLYLLQLNFPAHGRAEGFLCHPYLFLFHRLSCF